MSQWYKMNISVDGIKKKEKEKVADAIEREWGNGDEAFEDISAHTNLPLYTYEYISEGSLCGGEEEFTDRVTHSVWKVLGRYVEISVHATCLEELPCESHVRDEDHYEEWIKSQSNTNEEATNG